MGQKDYINSEKTQSDFKNSPYGAYGRGVAQGLTLELADEMEALARSVFSNQGYDEELQKIHNQIDSYKRSHPNQYLGGQITGGVGSLAVPTSLLARAGKLGQSAYSGGKLMGLARATGALTAEGAFIGAITEYNEARGDNKNLDTALKGGLFGAIFAPIGGSVGYLAGNLISPFFNYVQKTMGKQATKNMVNALQRYARAGQMNLNDALKKVITENIPLIEIDKGFMDLGKMIAFKHKSTAGNDLFTKTRARELETKKDMYDKSMTDLLPTEKLSAENVNTYTNFLDKFDEMIAKQGEVTEQAYKKALSPSQAGIDAVPSNEIIKAFNNLIEVNPKLLKKTNELIRSEYNLSYDPFQLKKNKYTGEKKLINLIEKRDNKKLTMDIIESVSQEAKKLTYNLKGISSKTGHNIRLNQQEPLTKLINEKLPNLPFARASATTQKLMMDNIKALDNALSKKDPDPIISHFKKSLDKIKSDDGKKKWLQFYQTQLAREIRNSFNNVNKLNALIRDLNDPNSTAFRLFNEFYPNKKIEELLMKVRKARNSLEARQTINPKVETSWNIQEAKNVSNPLTGGLDFGSRVSRSGTNLGLGLDLASSFVKKFMGEGMSEREAIRLARMLTDKTASRGKENLLQAFGRKENIDNIFSIAGKHGGVGGTSTAQDDVPKNLDELIRMMR